jgi:ParB/RepB/Spo0J family partition protein
MAEVKKSDYWKVSYEDLIVREGFNEREDYGNLQELAASIKENGVKVPLSGYKDGNGKFVVKDGHRRHAAIGLFIHEIEGPFWIPFMVEAKGYTDEQRLIDMFIMNDGKPLTPLEMASGIGRLINYGYSEREIAAKIAKSQSYVNKLASLNSAPKKLLNLIQEGRVAASLAIEFIGNGEADQFVADVLAGKYDKHPPEADIFPYDAPRSRITRSAVQTVNSWKGFKTFAKTADDGKMEANKAKFFKFLCQIMNNELTEIQIQAWFAPVHYALVDGKDCWDTTLVEKEKK